MKIRIKSHSIRFRVDEDDLQRIQEDGFLTLRTHIPTPGGEPIVFSSRVARAQEGEESRLTAEPFGFTFILSSEDCKALASDEDGIYVRREWTNGDDHQVRFVAYIEKDKKARLHQRDQREQE